MNRFAVKSTIFLSILLFGGSLFLFGKFIILGPFTFFCFDFTESQVLIWDGFLSILFFFQHSVMVRTFFRNWIALTIPHRYQPTLYSIVSSVVLSFAMLFWQPSQTLLFQIPVQLKFLPYAMLLISISGFMWGIFSLRSFDPLGITAILKHSGRKNHLPPPEFVVRGPYLWVRHPLYTFVIILIWSSPDICSDRLLFNVLWTCWIIIGSFFEEKNLVAEFGDKYRLYQKTVPMLFPWKGPAGNRLIENSYSGR